MNTKRIEELKAQYKHQMEILREERIKEIKELWDNLKPFENEEQVPDLPKVDTEEWKNRYVPKLIACGAIPKKNLVHGKYYIGNHRIARIAQWDAEKQKFLYWRHKFRFFIDNCNHFEDDNGFALFVPIRETNKEEFDKTCKD